jgi:predicted TIM-barrel fold metal-dependent hydrolase
LILTIAGQRGLAMDGIIDAHVHYIPQEAGVVPGGPVENLGYGRVKFPNGKIAQILPQLCTRCDFQIETLLRVMESNGVARCVLLQGPVYGLFNEPVAQEARARPERFIGSALIDPLSPRVDEQFRTLVDEQGIRVLKFECSESTGLMGLHPGLTFDDAAFHVIWRKVDDAEMAVVIDPGSIAGAGYQVEALAKVVAAYPRAHFVIAHLGFPEPARLAEPRWADRWWSMMRLARRANVWIEISAMPYFFSAEEYPYPTAVDLILRVKDEVGVGKLIWGSDIPGTLQYATYRQMIGFVDRSPRFTEAEKARILRHNALDAFRLP